MQRTGRLQTPRAQRLRRSRAARALVILAVMFLSAALFRLQVTAGDTYALEARSNRLRELPIIAPRGTIYDRHGRVVAENIPAYQVLLMPPPIRGAVQVDSMQARLEGLREIAELTDADMSRAMRKWRQATHLPMVVLRDASPQVVARLQERNADYPQVLVHEYAKRHYPAGEAIAHFIGYVSEISPRQLEQERFAGYRQGRWVGQGGLELQYEERLGGTPGSRFLEIDARGNIKRWLPEEAGLPPIPGKDLHLHLDLDLQEYIHEIFPREFQGAIVAIDPQTGGVLAYYSYPTFDPNEFIGGIPQALWDSLRTDPATPLLDRVVASGQPAASTWKLAVAGMALDLGVIKPDEYMPISCTGGMTFGRYARCHGVHGRQNLIEGIKNSCNVYFYQVGVRIGLERMLEHGVRLGFGDKTGIDVPHELRPNWPEGLDYYQRRFGYRPKEPEVLNLAIGQGPINMTIIKLAHIYAALTAPSGKVPAPRLAMESNTVQDTAEFHTTPLDRWYLEAGMRRVVTPGGTAQLTRLPWWDFIGKTGTAQAPPGRDHGWFVGTGAKEPGAPPEIAVTMFLARAEHGYTPSGYVGEVVNFYLSRKYGRPFVKWATPRFRGPRGLAPIDPLFLSRPVVDPPRPAPTAEDARDVPDDPPPQQPQQQRPQPLGTPIRQ